MAGVSVYRSRLYGIDRHGDATTEIDRVALPDRSTIMVHGYRFSPWDDRHNPHLELFPSWRAWAGRDAFGFGWYSAGGCLAPARAWLSGRWNSYRFAWDCAAEAGAVLARLIGDQGPQVQIVAHSLGARVALKALRCLRPRRVDRLLLIAGAEYSQAALATAIYAQTPTLSLACKHDLVLERLGQLCAPDAFLDAVVGFAGLDLDRRPRCWRDLWLDDPLVHGWGTTRGWDLQCDLSRVGDHWHYQHPGNHGLLQHWVEGGVIDF